MLPEPERASDDRRRFGYEGMIRLLRVRTMADAGIALDDIRDTLAGSMVSAGADSGDGVAGILARLEDTIAGRTGIAAETDRRAADGAKLEM